MTPMPRKKAEPKEDTQTDTQSTSETATEFVESPDTLTQPDVAGKVHKGQRPGTNGTKRAVSKLDSLDFYRTQLKLEALESDVAKTDKEAGEINLRILEILKIHVQRRMPSTTRLHNCVTTSPVRIMKTRTRTMPPIRISAQSYASPTTRSPLHNSLTEDTKSA